MHMCRMPHLTLNMPAPTRQRACAVPGWHAYTPLALSLAKPIDGGLLNISLPPLLLLYMPIA
jgi:hypothetical protein